MTFPIKVIKMKFKIRSRKKKPNQMSYKRYFLSECVQCRIMNHKKTLKMPQTRNIDLLVVNWTITIAIKNANSSYTFAKQYCICDPKKVGVYLVRCLNRIWHRSALNPYSKLDWIKDKSLVFHSYQSQMVKGAKSAHYP